jgi:hypothetical protein
MKRSTFLLILLSAWVGMASCSKNDPGPSKTLLLTQNDWKYSTFTSTDPRIQSYMTIALAGSEFHFSTDKTSTLTYVNTSTPSTYTWTFTSDERSLVITGATSTISYELVTLDGSNLHFKTTGTITNIYKFVKK